MDLHHAIGEHGIGDFDKPRDVGPFDIINMAVRLTVGDALVVNAVHNVLQFAVHFFPIPAQTHAVLGHFQSRDSYPAGIGRFSWGVENFGFTEDFNARKPVRHPLFGTHRETGRKVFYFDPVKISHIEGMESDESNALIDELAGYMTPNGTQYTHKWQKGDIVIWDNRCSYHKAAGDYPPEEDRIHWRVSIKEPQAVN